MTQIRRKTGPCPVSTKSQTELARHLVPPRDRKIIQLAMRKDGCPGREADGSYHVQKWNTFINENFESRTAADQPDKLELEMERLRLQNEKLTFELQVKRKDFTANADIERHVGGMVMAAKSVLLKIPSKMAPLVVGRTEVDAELLLKAEVNAALEHLANRPWA